MQAWRQAPIFKEKITKNHAPPPAGCEALVCCALASLPASLLRVVTCPGGGQLGGGGLKQRA